MSNWYISREDAKSAMGLADYESNRKLDRIIEGCSRRLDNCTHTNFIPKTETRYYRWPTRQPTRATYLWLDQYLISVTTLQTQAQNTSPTTISSSDYFLEPVNTGPPYDRIEIDESSTAAFEAGDTPQRSISVLGAWGYSANTDSVGTVSSGLDSSATATTMVGSDGSLINVGDTLLIESEQLFVADRSFAALGSVLINGALTANISENVTADGSHGITAGEVIRVGDEEMYVNMVSTNVLYVDRGYNGTKVAAHNDDTAIHINRTLTVERGVNGTTAATHANATAVSKYIPPFDIQNWCLAEVINQFHQENSGWARTIGTGDTAREMTGRELGALRHEMESRYFRNRMAVV